jgi:hypothetical protein
MTKDSDQIFGWKSVFVNYKISDILKDCKYPICIAAFLTIIIVVHSSNFFISLAKIVSISLSILPNIIALLLAGYAIILTLWWSEYGKNIRKYPKGIELLQNINSSYAATILFMAIALLFSFVLDIIISLEISVVKTTSKWINGITIFLISTLLIYSIWLLKDITINIYNLGQASSFFDCDTNSGDANR